MMKKSLFTALIICSFFFVAQAQGYKTAIGLRLGYPASVSLKHFISEKGAVEVFAGYRGYSGYSWFNVGAAYEHHSPIESVDGLQWYFGGGAAAYFWRWNDGFVYGDAGSTSFGILGTLGLDYKFEDYPVNLSADWMPLFALNGFNNGFYGGYGALSVRYTLKGGDK